MCQLTRPNIQVATLIPGGNPGVITKKKKKSTFRNRNVGVAEDNIVQTNSPAENMIQTQNILDKPEVTTLFRKTIDPFYERPESILISKVRCNSQETSTDKAHNHPPHGVKISFTYEPRVIIVNDTHKMIHRAMITLKVDDFDEVPEGVVEYKSLHRIIVADAIGDASDFKKNAVSRMINESKPDNVDQLMYKFDHLMKIYIPERVPWCITRQVVDEIVARVHIGMDKQILEAVDTRHGRIIVNLNPKSIFANEPSLRKCIESCDTDQLIEKHLMVLWRYNKPPQKINKQYIHMLVRKAVLLGLSRNDIFKLRELSNGLEMAREFIDTLDDTYGWQFNLFYKEQLLEVIEELFSATFKLESE